jgi:hypothetical protein
MVVVVILFLPLLSFPVVVVTIVLLTRLAHLFVAVQNHRDVFLMFWV